MATVIRTATPEDVGAIQSIYAPYVLETPISFEEQLPTLDEMRRRMQTGYPWLVATQEEDVIGYAYGGQHRPRPAYRWSVEVTVYVAQKAQRSGAGRLLYSTLFDRLADLGFCTAFAGITLPNKASVGLHEALGFAPIGVFKNIGYKFGRWHDVGWWQRALREPPDRPEELRI